MRRCQCGRCRTAGQPSGGDKVRRDMAAAEEQGSPSSQIFRLGRIKSPQARGQSSCTVSRARSGKVGPKRALESVKYSARSARPAMLGDVNTQHGRRSGRLSSSSLLDPLFILIYTMALIEKVRNLPQTSATSHKLL